MERSGERKSLGQPIHVNTIADLLVKEKGGEPCGKSCYMTAETIPCRSLVVEAQ